MDAADRCAREQDASEGLRTLPEEEKVYDRGGRHGRRPLFFAEPRHGCHWPARGGSGGGRPPVELLERSAGPAAEIWWKYRGAAGAVTMQGRSHLLS